MPKKDIAIVGSGGLAKEVRWVIEENNRNEDKWRILGWISKEKPGTMIAGLPVLGDDDWLLDHKEPIDVVVSVGDGNLRKRIVTSLKQNKNISFPTIVSPSAEVGDSVEIGEGAIITAKSILTVDIKIGSFFFCNLASTVGHDCIFNDFVTLNPGVHVSGSVCLGECVTVGTGATIIQGLLVGDHASIGAGAAVVRNVAANSTVAGVPAKVLEKSHE